MVQQRQDGRQDGGPHGGGGSGTFLGIHQVHGSASS